MHRRLSPFRRLPATMLALVPIVFAFVASALPARGATFYCDPAKGSPQGDGSAAKPWRTIEEVLAAKLIQLRDADGKPANPAAPVKPGDTVLLRIRLARHDPHRRRATTTSSSRWPPTRARRRRSAGSRSAADASGSSAG